MSITVGRVGYDVTLNNPTSYTLDGDVLTMTGVYRITSTTDFKTLRQQMNGLVDNPWERWVPFTFSTDSTLDGFYQVLSASIDTAPTTYRSGFASYNLSLLRVPGYNSAWAESNLVGAARSGKPGGVTASTWHGIPTTAATISDSTGGWTSNTRTGPSGACYIATDASRYYDLRPKFRLAPANWYDMAATLKIGSVAVVGRQVVSDPTTWELSNGLMKVAPNGTSSTLLNLTPLSGRAGSAYGSAIGIKLGSFSAGTISPVTTATSVVVLRNTPEECIVRLLCSLSGSAFNVDIGLRRGSLFATVAITGPSAQWGIQTASVTAFTSQTGGMYATSGGATTLVVSSAKTFTTDLVNGKIYLTSASTFHDLGIGCTDESAPGATAPDRRTDVRDQYFAATYETQSVVAQ